MVFSELFFYLILIVWFVFVIKPNLVKELSVVLSLLMIMMTCMMYDIHFMEYLYMDKSSKIMIELLILLSSILIFISSSKGKVNIIMMVMMIVYLFFGSNSLLSMYIMFELSLIPLMFMILMFGYQPERLKAGRFMMLYTIISSMPLLVSILYMSTMFSTEYIGISMWENILSKDFSFVFILSLFMSFLVKIPLYMFHSWLPKAHVEAPVEGSMILAGIMLKMGSFGIIRFNSIFHGLNKSILFNIIISMASVGCLMSCIMSISSDDIKMSVAYSSIGHMNYMLCALLTMKTLSLNSCLMIMISHGLSSVILFFIVTLSYSISHSRSSLVSKGCLSFNPAICMFMLISWSLNFACPPSSSFVGEVWGFITIVSSFSFMWFTLLLYVLFNSFFSLMNYGIMSHSNSKLTYKSDAEKISDMITMTTFIVSSSLIFFFVNLIV